MSETREMLQQGLQSAFWQAFVAHVQAEWGAGGTRFERQIDALADGAGDDAQALLHMRQIAVARREILRLLEWPREAIAKATPKEATENHSRRGGL